MNRKWILLLVLPALVLQASAAFAYSFDSCTFGRYTWNSSNVSMGVSTISFPPFTFIRDAVDVAAAGWNVRAPGTNFRYSLYSDAATSFASGDDKNSILFTSGYNFDGALAVAVTRRNCFFTSKITEADVYYNPAYTWSFDTAPFNPINPFSPYNVTLVGIHELGHAFGLNHQNGTVATMNSIYPNGGTLGNFNSLQPHADDVNGDRAGYGTCCTARDLAASTYRWSNALGYSDWIPAPSIAYRGHPTSFQFTIANRGTQTETARVQFYLSTDRFIDTSDTQVGASTFSLGAGVTSTFNAVITVPMSQTPRAYFFGYIIDPLNSVPEVDESNNAVALTSQTVVPSVSPPLACFTQDVFSGNAPLFVSFDASCSSDPEGGPLTYSWDFGNGSFGSNVNDFAFYGSQGFYTVWLTVTDNQGLSSSWTGFVQVFQNCEPGIFCPIE